MPEGGRVTSYQQDAAGRVTSITGPDPDGNGPHAARVTQLTQPDPDGAGPLAAQVTQYVYDARGNVTQVTHAGGATESWTYDATFDQVLTHTDELGHVWTYTLDAKGNRLTETDPL